MATRKISADSIARAAMTAIRAHDKGAFPTANPDAHEPRRVTAPLGDFRVEAVLPPASTETLLMIERNGAPMLKARFEAIWKGEKRTDKIEVVDVHGNDWFAAFLGHAPRLPEAEPQRRRKARRNTARPKAARKPRMAGAKARKPRRARRAGTRTKRAGAKNRRRRRG